MATERGSSHAAIALRSATTDCKGLDNCSRISSRTSQNTLHEPITHQNNRSLLRDVLLCDVLLCDALLCDVLLCDVLLFDVLLCDVL